MIILVVTGILGGGHTQLIVEVPSTALRESVSQWVRVCDMSLLGESLDMTFTGLK